MKRRKTPKQRPLHTPGTRLRALRIRRRFTMRDVEEISARIAFRMNATKYLVRRGLLSNYENDKLVPSIFKLHSLSYAYGCRIRTLLDCYGIPKVMYRRTRL